MPFPSTVTHPLRKGNTQPENRETGSALREGLLWYDPDPVRTLPEKIGRAARRYAEKFGVAPNVVYLNPETATGFRGTGVRTVIETDFGGQEIVSLDFKLSPYILPNHFWIGVAEV